MRELVTPRLRLRTWREEDLAPFAALNADPVVAEYLGGPIARAASDTLAARAAAHFDQHGYGPWAIEVIGGPAFIGFVGLSIPTFSAPFTPCVEIGWRIAGAHWGKGYATEGARAALAHGFGALGLGEIVAFTVPANLRSRRVMDKIGLTQDLAGDFDHPALPAGHPLRRHVLYRAQRPGPAPSP